MRSTITVLLLLALSACAQQPIEIPIYKRAVPPAELSEWQPGRLPLWIGPGVTATSCLTPEGEDQLRALIWDMKTRIRAWEAWAKPATCSEKQTDTACLTGVTP